MKTEIVQISDGAGRIRILGDDAECSLMFDQQPVAFHWADCQGSIAQYLVRGVPADVYQGALEQIRSLVRGAKQTPTMAEALHYLLQMFEPGQYLISNRIANNSQIIEFSAKDNIKTHSVNYYPYEDTIICTQPREYLDEKVVLAYVQDMEQGGRPLVLVAGLYRGSSIFVLDGHHKLEAYKRLKSEPPIIEILRVTGRSMMLREGEQAFGEATCLRDQYQNFKTDNFPYGSAERPPIPVGDSAELFSAIKGNRLAEVKSLLEQNPGLSSAVNEEAATPLLVASQCGAVSIVKEILKHSPDICAEQEDGIMALQYAALGNNVDLVNLLIDAGCPADAENSKGEVALLTAAAYNKLAVVKALIARGARINSRQGSALVRAATGGHLEVVKYLLQQGADPNWNRINDYGIDEIAGSGRNAACRLIQEFARDEDA